MCGLVLFTGIMIVAVADRSGQANTQTMVNLLFRQVSQRTVAQTRDFIGRAAPVAESLQQLSGRGLAMDDLDRLALQLLAFLQGNPGMTWVLYGDESGDYTGATRLLDELHIEHAHGQRANAVEGLPRAKRWLVENRPPG